MAQIEIIFLGKNPMKSKIIFLSALENLTKEDPAEKIFVVDKKVFGLYEKKLSCIWKDRPLFLFDAKEKNKSLSYLEMIFHFFLENKVKRETIIFAIGGGITLDIAALASSIFKRGCRLILMPTTFLGMIDAAIGGKTAVNFQNYKNLIGSFYPAEKIYINLNFLETLSSTEKLQGWAECVKIALIENDELLRTISARQEITENIIKKAIELKLSFCEQDLFDSSERRKLNLGHTFGHVLESLSEFRLSHGEAVSLGMRAAAKFSYEENLISKIRYDQINNILNKFDFPKKIRSKISNWKERALKILQQDKKFEEKNVVICFQKETITIRKISPGKLVTTLSSIVDQPNYLL